jgi:hypothetical protein
VLRLRGMRMVATERIDMVFGGGMHTFSHCLRASAVSISVDGRRGAGSARRQQERQGGGSTGSSGDYVRIADLRLIRGIQQFLAL